MCLRLQLYVDRMLAWHPNIRHLRVDFVGTITALLSTERKPQLSKTQTPGDRATQSQRDSPSRPGYRRRSMDKKMLRRIGWVGASLGLTSVLVGCSPDIAADSSAGAGTSTESSAIATSNG